MGWLRRWWVARQERRAINERKRTLASIRREFAWWGHDLSDLSDEELEAQIRSAARRFNSLGLSADEVTRFCQEMGRPGQNPVLTFGSTWRQGG